MSNNNVSSTEFQNQAGRYIDEAAKAPVFITRHKRRARVLIDIEEYERLKSLDTRQAFYPHELSQEIKTNLEAGYQGEPTPEIDHLLK